MRPIAQAERAECPILASLTVLSAWTCIVHDLVAATGTGRYSK